MFSQQKSRAANVPKVELCSRPAFLVVSPFPLFFFKFIFVFFLFHVLLFWLLLRLLLGGPLTARNKYFKGKKKAANFFRPQKVDRLGVEFYLSHGRFLFFFGKKKGREAETSLLKKIKSPYLTDCLFLGLVLLLLPLLFHVFTI